MLPNLQRSTEGQWSLKVPVSLWCHCSLVFPSVPSPCPSSPHMSHMWPDPVGICCHTRGLYTTPPYALFLSIFCGSCSLGSAGLRQSVTDAVWDLFMPVTDTDLEPESLNQTYEPCLPFPPVWRLLRCSSEQSKPLLYPNMLRNIDRNPRVNAA